MPSHTYIRYGLDWVRYFLYNSQDKPEGLKQALKLLRNTITGPKAHIYQLYSVFKLCRVQCFLRLEVLNSLAPMLFF